MSTVDDGAPPEQRRDDVGWRDDVASKASLFRAILKKDVLLLIRYPLDTAARLTFLFVFFAIIFFGGRAAGGAALSETLGGLIVGYFLWTMSVTAYMGLAQNLQSEATWGTLEQLYMSPHGFGTVMAMKTVSNVLLSFFWGGSILTLMLATTGREVSVDLVTVLPLTVLTLCSAVGIGFVMGGLALLYKRVNNLVGLMQFGMVGLISAPAFDVPWLRYLPLAQGSGMLQRAMRGGVRLWEFSATEHAILLGTAVGYVLAGYVVFRLATERARKLGVMGEY